MDNYDFIEKRFMVHILNRATAKKIGLTTYFTGKPCKHGHIQPRFVSDKSCTGCRKQSGSRRCSTQEYKEYKRMYYKENKDRYRETGVAWQKNNRERINARARENNKIRYKNDPKYKAACAARNALRNVLCYGAIKTEDTESVNGYTYEQFYDSINSKLLEGMTWDNYGEWHIDHKIPVSVLIREGVYEPSVINSLDNLIPMWASDNISKNNRTLSEWLCDDGVSTREVEMYHHFL